MNVVEERNIIVYKTALQSAREQTYRRCKECGRGIQLYNI